MDGLFTRKKPPAQTQNDSSSSTTTTPTAPTGLFQSLTFKSSNNNNKQSQQTTTTQPSTPPPQQVVVTTGDEHSDTVDYHSLKKRPIKKIKNVITRPGRGTSDDNDDDQDDGGQDISINGDDEEIDVIVTPQTSPSQTVTDSSHLDTHVSEQDHHYTLVVEQQPSTLNDHHRERDPNIVDSSSQGSPISANNNNNNDIDDNQKDNDENQLTETINRYTERQRIFKYSIESIKDSCQKMFYESKSINTTLDDNARRIIELEEEQARAVDSDDFELAHTIDGQIQEIRDIDTELKKKQVSMLNMQMLDGGAAGESLDTTAQRYREELSTIVDNMTAVRLKHVELAQQYQEQVANDLANLVDEIAVKEEIVSREQSHVELDQELLDKSIASLDDTIAVATEPLTNDRLALQEKRNEKQLEIEQLTRLLDEKHREQAQLDSEINDVDAKIEQARGKFHKEFSRIDKKKADVQKKLRHIEVLTEELVEIKQQHDTKKNPKDHQSFKLIQQVDQVIDQHSTFDNDITNSITSITVQQTVLNTIYNDVLEHTETIELLNKKMDSITLNIESLQSSILSKQKDNGLLKNSINVIMETIPQLEQSKNQAKDAKQFVEAGNILNEIKQQQQLVVEKKQQLAEMQNALDVDTTLVTSLKGELESIQAQRQDHQKTMYQHLVAHLSKRQQELQEEQQRVGNIWSTFNQAELDWLDNQLVFIRKQQQL
ncbi:hypothetical protein SAMD00019534_107340 [Acytostelium subglobosum LB1]|uniref:hypothetical protein n=1 Tax=Acytostelium subglobosum LB1 TaxID=1410327 RepID=UPI00064485EF|nr:hypothetical protein SAMD00019534_107340 [Acytostelium subglobosum LB1]GAM27558.1 hypothetical protein SAMD00019534_107340 [Acytostelium subglobosum LB1]|eukprot:XP_012749623.1 hypothetical protein SAMD00019534_107340 [Acytostelium subglobosum LB1]